MRKRVWIPLTLVAVAAIGFFGVAPGRLEAGMNQLDGKAGIPVSAEALALHKTLTVVDLHGDTLMWRRDLLEPASRGHIDLPRLQQGNVALQLFSSVTKSPRGLNYDGNADDSDNITPLAVAQLQPPRTWSSLLERSLWHAEKLDRAVAASQGALVKVTDPASLDALLAARASGQGTVGGLMTIEGLQNLEGKLDNLDRLHQAGFRMAGLAHFFDNEVAGSMHGVKKGGITPLGWKVVARMEELGMIVDIAHLSHRAVAELLPRVRRPVVSSHGGVQATCKTNRNLTDEELRGVAATGGVVGIGYWDGAVCSTDPRAVARAIRHVRDTVGIDHVALGSDFDGSTTTRFDTAGLAQVTQALLDEGFTGDEIRKVMGLNALRVIRAGIAPMNKAPPAP